MVSCMPYQLPSLVYRINVNQLICYSKSQRDSTIQLAFQLTEKYFIHRNNVLKMFKIINVFL